MALALQVQSAVSSVTEIDYGTTGLKAFLGEAMTQFSLGPDEYTDLKRMPQGISSLDDLMSYLKSAQDKIADDPELARTDGSLRTYKNLVLAIHACHDYFTKEGAIAKGKNADIADKICRQAVASSNADLGTGATKMWQAVFTGKCLRVRRVISFLLLLAQNPNA
jgi:hypothetical protein